MEWFGVFLIIMVVVIPVMAVTARMSLRPMVDAILRLRDGLAQPEGRQVSDARLGELEAAVADLRRELHRLKEAEAFHTHLAAGSAAETDAAEADQSPSVRR